MNETPNKWRLVIRSCRDAMMNTSVFDMICMFSLSTLVVSVAVLPPALQVNCILLSEDGALAVNVCKLTAHSYCSSSCGRFRLDNFCAVLHDGWMDGWMDGRTDGRMYVCMYVCLYVCMYVCMCVFVCVCVCMNVCMCMYVCVCMYV